MFSLTPATTLWDRDEPRFATAVREMVRSGRFLTPTFGGEVRPQKPILFYWLASASVLAFGFSETSVRLVSAVSIAVALLATGALARRLSGPAAVPWSALVLAVSPLVVFEGGAATVDALLLACIACALAVFAAGREEGFGDGRIAAMALALGAGLLTKGPVGLVIPLVAAAGALLLDRRWKQPVRGTRALLLASALAIGVFLAWFLPANAATGGRLLREGLGHEVLRRATSPLEGHGGAYPLGLPYYALVALVGFAPWIAFLPAAIYRLTRERSRAASLLLSWIVLTLAFFSLVATRLPHYILPIAPAIAVAVAALLAELSTAPPDTEVRRWLRRGRALSITLGLLLAVFLFVLARLTPIPGTRPWLIALLALQLVALASLTTLLFRERWLPAARLLVAASAILEITAVWGLLHAAEAGKPVPRIAALLRREAPTAPVATLDFGEPSLELYADRSPIRHLASDDEAVRWLNEPRPGVLVLPMASLVRIERRAGRPRVLGSESGWNVGNGQPLHLVAVLRGPS